MPASRASERKSASRMSLARYASSGISEMTSQQDNKLQKIAEEYKLAERDVSLPLAKRFTKKEIRELICKLFGNTSELCKALDCTRSQLLAYLDKQPDLKQEMKDAREAVVDKAEKVMTSLLDSQNEQIQQKTAEYVLKSLGKSRGWAIGDYPAMQVNVSKTGDDIKVQLNTLFGLS